MNKICIFGGTVEGRKLSDFLVDSGAASVTVCVATEYGLSAMKNPEGPVPPENLTIRLGRMDKNEMADFFRAEKFDLVINAAHPYAVEAERNIKNACDETNTEHIRLLRAGAAEGEGRGLYIASAEEAVDYLNTTGGNIFITTGAKELPAYTAIKDYKERVYVRILPFGESLATARENGFAGNRIIAMQGPFSEELNTAMLKAANARYLVTKEGGKEGGFYEKLAAAENAGAEVIIIGRKQTQKGLSYAETVKRLTDRFALSVKPKVSIVGIGPGDNKHLTLEALEAIKNSDGLIGSQRALDGFKSLDKPSFAAIAPEKIMEIIEKNAWLGSFAVLMAGDTGFYSGTKKLMEIYEEAHIISGISSVSYFCAKLGISWDDIKLLSLHGRSGRLIHAVKNNLRTMALVGGSDGVNKLAQELCQYGFNDARLTVGEKLSYPDERIVTGTVDELLHGDFDSLCIVLIENQSVQTPVTYGFADDAFTRGDVPMTKSEIRSVIMSKLRPGKDAVAFDIGAGTGSVAVEMAVAACNGDVYAIEKNPGAIPLIEANRHTFKLPNLHIITGTAPRALDGLPQPTHAFIGGSSGNMREIIAALLAVNTHIRMVATAITLETVCEVMLCAKEFGFKEFEAVQLWVGKSKKLGGYNMMMGQNPVYIITMQNPAKEECI